MSQLLYTSEVVSDGCGDQPRYFFFVAFKAKGERDSFGVPKPKAVTII
jgi:hypothetical protein